MSASESQTIDCASLSLHEIHEQIRSSDGEATIKLTSVDGQHGLCAGIADEGSIQVDGSVGDFAALAASVENLEIDGNVKSNCAHSLAGGRVLVKGSSGSHTGAFAASGFVAVLGTAGDYCGYGMCGADLLVRSMIGNYAGCGMTKGVLVLGNGAGQHTGQGMRGGAMYIRGEVQGLSDDVKASRLKDTDAMRLSLLLARAGIKGDPKEFKAYRPKNPASE